MQISNFRQRKWGSLVTRAALSVMLLANVPSFSQSNLKLQEFFRNNIGLSEEQIAAIKSGRAVVKAMPSRSPAEVLLFGAVYVHAAPEKYIQFAHDFDRLRQLPNYLALGVFSNLPQLSDLSGFSFDDDDIKALKDCKPGDCLIQMPASSMDQAQKAIDWSAADVSQQVNDLLHKAALEHIRRYQREGNQALGVFRDKRNPTDVPQQFAYMLSYAKVLPEQLPDFHRYLLEYPDYRPANTDDAFYWGKVKFGLKPTLRIVHLITMRGKPGDPVIYAVAEKQLYSSHYFETAFDLSFCVRAGENAGEPGFYLIKAMGSEQVGLTGLKGSIVRKAAVSSSLSNLQKALTAIRNTLEQSRNTLAVEVSCECRVLSEPFPIPRDSPRPSAAGILDSWQHAS